MAFELKKVIWGCFLASLLLIPQGIMIRLSNENINKCIIPAADYYEFYESIERIGGNFDDFLDHLQASSVRTIAVKECPSGNPNYTGPYFDQNLLFLLHKKGFEILLRPKSTSAADAEYFVKLDSIIKAFDIKYMLFDGPLVPGYPYKLDMVENILKDNNIILGIVEPKEQVGYQKQLGLEKLLPASDYSINRAYITPANDLAVLDKEGLMHRWLRGVLDRSIRFVYISPLQNPQKSIINNVSETLSAVSDLCNILDAEGYCINIPLKKMSPGTPDKIHYLLVSLSLFISAELYLDYTFRNNKKVFLSASAVTGIALIAMDMLYLMSDIDMPQYLAAIAAILYPALAGAAALSYMIKKRGCNYFADAAAVLGYNLVICGIGAYTVVTTMSDVRYTMNLETFHAVIEAYIIPLILFTAACLTAYPKLKSTDFKALCLAKLKSTGYKSCIPILAGVLLLYIYVSRSGDSSLIPASATELRFRAFLEDIFLVRPRFKEFIVGYPCLFIFVYITRKYGLKLFSLLSGIGMVIGSISIVNSFCHVFTSIAVSCQRTVNGLVLGLAAGSVSLLISVMLKTVSLKSLSTTTPLIMTGNRKK